MLPGGKRRPSFKMVSNMVIQLLHSIKYSVEVPFSNMAQQPVEIQKTVVAKKVIWRNDLGIFFNLRGCEVDLCSKDIWMHFCTPTVLKFFRLGFC
jgi:hypothetical protein